MNVRAGKTVENNSKAAAHNFIHQQIPSANLSAFLPIQRETPAEAFARTDNSEEDPAWALIGTDKARKPLVSTELATAKALGMALPAYLAGYLKTLGNLPWGELVNNQWMEIMMEENRIFVLQHEAIPELLDAGHDAFFNSEINPHTGTWKEVETLLAADYAWYKGLLIPPGLAPGYIAADQARLAAIAAAPASAAASPAAAGPSAAAGKPVRSVGAGGAAPSKLNEKKSTPAPKKESSGGGAAARDPAAKPSDAKSWRPVSAAAAQKPAPKTAVAGVAKKAAPAGGGAGAAAKPAPTSYASALGGGSSAH